MSNNKPKYLIIIGDGMADLPIAACDNQTPVAYAKTPNLDYIAKTGILGRAQTIPTGMAPGSDVANMSILGYDPIKYYKGMGRASIEAAAMGINIASGEFAFRCNLVAIQNNTMIDYSAGHIETSDAHAIIKELATALGSHTLRFYPGVSYRHIAVFTGIDAQGMDTIPPHDISGKEIGEYLPRGPGSEAIRKIMTDAHAILTQSPTNARRKAQGKLPVSDIWLWGQGGSLVLPKLKDQYGLEGAVITAVDLVRGIGTLAGLEVAAVDGATGYLDTNYRGKVDAARNALLKGNFAYLHIEAPDETSHEGDLGKKLQAIEDFDRLVVGPSLEFMREMPMLRILAMPDHATLLSTKTHDSMPVPFAVCGPGINHNGAEGYSEALAHKFAPRAAPELFAAFVTDTNTKLV